MKTSRHGMPYYQNSQDDILAMYADGLPLKWAVLEYLKTRCDRETGEIWSMEYDELAAAFDCSNEQVSTAVRELMKLDWLYRFSEARSGRFKAFIMGREFTYQIVLATNQRKANDELQKENGTSLSTREITNGMHTNRSIAISDEFLTRRETLRTTRKGPLRALSNGHYNIAERLKVMFTENVWKRKDLLLEIIEPDNDSDTC